MDLWATFARKLKLARQAKGLSQEELAHRADLDRNYVGILERREKRPTLSTVQRLAVALEIHPLVLLAEPDDLRKALANSAIPLPAVDESLVRR